MLSWLLPCGSMATHHVFCISENRFQNKVKTYHSMKKEMLTAAGLWNECLKILWSSFFSSGVVIHPLEDSEIVELEA